MRKKKKYITRPKKNPKFARKVFCQEGLRFTLWLQYGGKLKDAVAWYASQINTKYTFPDDSELDTAAGYFTQAPDCENTGLVWVSDEEGSNVIPHEAGHAAIYICKLFKINPTTGQEFLCRQIGVISAEMTNLWRKVWQ